LYKYGYNKPINYTELGEWSKSRSGQIIVCENVGADWMDFSGLVSMAGQRKPSLEAIWTNTL